MATKSKSKPVVFISHITEEKEIAVALQSLVEKSFLSAVELFVSSDDKSIPKGTEWLPKIKQRLTDCIFEIVLASPESIGRVWIGFEAGAVWIRDKPVIALCHSGMTKDQLPPPLGHLQNLDATNESHLKSIFNDLANELGMDCPSVDFSHFIYTVETFGALSDLNLELEEHALIASKSGLSAIEVATLKAIAGFTDAVFGRTHLHHIVNAVNAAGFHSSAATTAVKMLTRKGFVSMTVQMLDFEECVFVSMEEIGWDWMAANHTSLDFNLPPPTLGTPTPPF